MSEADSSSEMPSVPDARDATTLIEVRSYFVRERNALAVHASFERLYVDYYLHLMDQAVQYPPELDLMLKDGLAAVVLHATTRPWKETHAWTLNIPNPLANLFVTASSLGESVTGRVFTDGVRETKNGLFYAQVKVQNEDPRQSTTEMKGSRVFDAVETFYQQSEQRRARIFELGDEEFFMISAQPDCDEEWLEALTPESARNLENDETLSLLETRKFRFECGCNLERIYPAIAPLASQGLDELFQGDEAITVTCPRCNAKWRLTREQIEAVMN